VAIVRACRKGGSINTKVDIGAGSGKDVFRPFRTSLPLYRVLSMVYSGGVSK